MTWHIIEQEIGYQQIADTSTTKQHPLGTIVRATDPTYGTGEFIYLLGVGSTAVGSWVVYSPDNFGTALLGADADGQVAIAMSANVASQYGWYQISGKAVGKCLTQLADNAHVWATGTAGSVDDASVAGDGVNLALTASATVVDSGVADFEIHRPYVNDQTSFS